MGRVQSCLKEIYKVYLYVNPHSWVIHAAARHVVEVVGQAPSLASQSDPSTTTSLARFHVDFRTIKSSRNKNHHVVTLSSARWNGIRYVAPATRRPVPFI